MNSQQAKELDLPALLSILGHEPVKIAKGGTEFWYLSPFRTEAEPSFIVSYGKVLPYVWNDFGDTSGTVLDFALRYKNFTSIRDALAWLDDLSGYVRKERRKRPEGQQPSLFSSNQQKWAAKPPKFFSGSPTPPDLRFLSAGPVRNPTIRRYLHAERAIPHQLIELYVQEVLYCQASTDRVFYAFGMANRSGGYEIRAATDAYPFKSALKARDVSLIKGNGSRPATANLFEGMLDFLSLLALYNVKQLGGDSIILHSLSSAKPAQRLCDEHGYTTLNLFFDNDTAGRKATAAFGELDHFTILPQNELYTGYKDVNDALCQNRVAK